MFSKSCVALDLNWKLLAGLLLPYLQLNFLIIQPLIASLLPCQVLSPLFAADVTSCRYFETLVHRAEVGGCSRTEVEDSSSSYAQS